MDSLIQGLQGVDISAGQLLSWIVAIVLAIGAMYKYLEKYRTIKNEIDIYKETVAEHGAKLTSLEQEVEAMKSNFDTDFKAMKQDEDADFERLNAKLDDLSKVLVEMQDYIKKRDMADLKDRISVLHEKYHARGTITRKEKETLWDLINAYNASGGNSFVHAEVIPEIPTWKVIE